MHLPIRSFVSTERQQRERTRAVHAALQGLLNPGAKLKHVTEYVWVICNICRAI